MYPPRRAVYLNIRLLQAPDVGPADVGVSFRHISGDRWSGFSVRLGLNSGANAPASGLSPPGGPDVHRLVRYSSGKVSRHSLLPARPAGKGCEQHLPQPYWEPCWHKSRRPVKSYLSDCYYYRNSFQYPYRWASTLYSYIGGLSYVCVLWLHSLSVRSL